jgi:hypothetical protein
LKEGRLGKELAWGLVAVGSLPLDCLVTSVEGPVLVAVVTQAVIVEMVMVY